MNSFNANIEVTDNYQVLDSNIYTALFLNGSPNERVRIYDMNFNASGVEGDPAWMYATVAHEDIETLHKWYEEDSIELRVIRIRTRSIDKLEARARKIGDVLVAFRPVQDESKSDTSNCIKMTTVFTYR